MGSDSGVLFNSADIDLAIDRLIAEDDGIPDAPRTEPTKRALRYDRAFESSVRAGYLTATQAVQRGDRETYIARLESRFDLPRDLALRVADGQVRLKHAVDECERRHAAMSVGYRFTWVWVAAAMVSIALLSGFFGAGRVAQQQQIARKLEGSSLQAPRPVVEAVDSGRETPRGNVERDADGWVTRVTAGHPIDALSTFCASATPGAGCSTSDVLPSKPRFPGRRLGRFTLDTDGRTWLIPIRRENRSGRWSIGTGLRPVAPTAQAPLQEGTSRVWPYVPEFVLADE